ncbi:MAG TPA: MaoC family dehydratase N-terminal domain-containing protein [Acidisphaera sp.]|nr:MaoC family dehydratase N-terminal domain-containing protein [Acidisphaera sp.]
MTQAEPTTPYAEWLGRTEHAHDTVVAGPLDRLAATLDRDEPPYADGDPAPPLSHWLLFLLGARQSTLGEDGHPKRGGFLPPVHELPRRMFAGGRFTFHHPIRVGMRVVRTSTIQAISERSGASGRLVFVTVHHAIRERANPMVLVEEEHDIVYRGLTAPAVKTGVETPPRGEWHRSLVPDPVLLFRYSALTFNGHRIHYDRSYVTGVEGYPGLIVHGPLTATLLLDLVRRNLPEAPVRAFSFRAASPLFDGNELHLNGTPPGPDGKVALWATNADGGLAMRAEATVG